MRGEIDVIKMELAGPIMSEIIKVANDFTVEQVEECSDECRRIGLKNYLFNAGEKFRNKGADYSALEKALDGYPHRKVLLDLRKNGIGNLIFYLFSFFFI